MQVKLTAELRSVTAEKTKLAAEKNKLTEELRGVVGKRDELLARNTVLEPLVQTRREAIECRKCSHSWLES